MEALPHKSVHQGWIHLHEPAVDLTSCTAIAAPILHLLPSWIQMDSTLQIKKKISVLLLETHLNNNHTICMCKYLVRELNFHSTIMSTHLDWISLRANAWRPIAALTALRWYWYHSWAAVEGSFITSSCNIHTRKILSLDSISVLSNSVALICLS